MLRREMKGPKIDVNERERGTLKVVTMVSIKKKSDRPHLLWIDQLIPYLK